MDTVNTRTNQDDIGYALLERCRNRDPEAYSALFSMYRRKIFNTAFRILGDESWAEDALQETMINIYRGMPQFRGDSKVSTWISRITVNVCLGMLRKAQSRPSVSLEDNPTTEVPARKGSHFDPLEQVARRELAALIETAFGRMSEKQGRVVRLHDLEGNTIPEIARMIRCPVGTVKSRLFYGRQEFKDIFNSLVGGQAYLN